MRPTGRPAYHTVFLSTLSLRRATTPNSGRTRNTIISIHALLAESDIFNTCCVKPIHAFLSTLSLRRATMWLFNPSTPTSHFYPRSPCGERRVEPFYTTARFYFYPRSPCGERQIQYRNLDVQHNFYPRSPCGERLLIYTITVEA